MGGGRAPGVGASTLRHGRGLRGTPGGKCPTGDAEKPSESTGALAGHTACTRISAKVGPRLDGGGGTAVRSEQLPAPSCRGVRLVAYYSKMTGAAPWRRNWPCNPARGKRGFGWMPVARTCRGGLAVRSAGGIAR